MTHQEKNKQWADSWFPGITAQGLADAVGKGESAARAAAKRLGLPLARPPRPRSFHSERNIAIVAKVKTGACTLKAIGESCGISRERVRQIAKKAGVAAVVGRGFSLSLQDRPDLVRQCPVCGEVFSLVAYPGRKNGHCSRHCAQRGRGRAPGEALWDAWCLWLRTGSMMRASQAAGFAPSTLSLHMRAWGMCLGRGRRAKPRKRREGKL